MTWRDPWAEFKRRLRRAFPGLAIGFAALVAGCAGCQMQAPSPVVDAAPVVDVVPADAGPCERAAARVEAICGAPPASCPARPMAVATCGDRACLAAVGVTCADAGP